MSVPGEYVVRIQGTNRAPMLIRTYVDGPIIGLKEGCIIIGEPVIMAGSMLVRVFGTHTRVLTILNNLHNEHGYLHQREEVHKPRYPA